MNQSVKQLSHVILSGARSLSVKVFAHQEASTVGRAASRCDLFASYHSSKQGLCSRNSWLRWEGTISCNLHSLKPKCAFQPSFVIFC